MKRLGHVLVLALALNFLAAAGAVGWLFRSGHLDRARVAQIKLLVFPPPLPPAPAAAIATVDPTTRPALALETLLAGRRDLSAGKQIDFIRQTFDVRADELDRRQQMLTDLQGQIDLARQKLESDRQAFDTERKQFEQERETARLQAQDQGFQDSLVLYSGMQPKQAKSIFMTLGDETVRRYLEAMDSKIADRIIGQFRTPDELDRIHRIMERMRTAQPTTQPTRE